MPAENPLRTEQSPFEPQDASADEPRAPEAGASVADGAAADAPRDDVPAPPEAEPLLGEDSRTVGSSAGTGDAPDTPGAQAPAPGLEAGGASEPALVGGSPPDGGASDTTAKEAGAEGQEASDEAPLAFAGAGAEAASDEGGGEAEGGGAEEPLPAESALRRRAQVAPALIALDRIDDDATFRMRPEGDVSRLATDVARVGQLFPVDVRLTGPDDRFQLVCGFRRVAALRFLHREFVLARVHTELGDEDALLMALAAAIHAAPVEPAQLEQVRDALSSKGLLFAAARDMLEKALAPDDDLSPGEDEEVDADQLAGEVAERLGTINQDLALVADEEVFRSLEPARREELLRQLRYSRDLVLYFESLEG